MSGAKRYDLARQHMDALLRAEQPPEPRWEVVERELLARIEQPAPLAPRAHRARSPLVQVLGLAAAAAIAAFALAGRPPGSSSPPSEQQARALDLAALPRATGEAGARGDLDFRALRPGDVLEAAGAEVSLVDAGSVRWTLLPSSRAVVRAVGAAGVGHVVALERGSIRAEVVTRDPAEGLVEAFAVEVGQTRVAVHGTRFTATRAGDWVEVDVEHGAVAVGPAGYRGATTGHLLVGPSRGAFSLDGGRVARFLPDPAVAAPSSAAPEPQSPPESAPGAPPPDPVTPRVSATPRPAASPSVDVAGTGGVSSAAPAAALEATPAAVRASLERCFASQRDGGSPSVHKSIVSQLRISLQSDGRVAGLRFDPPLRPALQKCAEPLFQRQFPAGQQEITIPLTLND